MYCVEFPFLNRTQEVARLREFARRSEGSFAVIYGRRRCGKSRLLLEAIPPDQLTYHLADEREPALQRSALATRLAQLKPGFDQVTYPDWDSLLFRWWQEAPDRSILALDEFPALATRDPALPSLIQRYLDSRPRSCIHLILCGSSQRLMQGLVLDRTAPLYGRAVELLRIQPLWPGWLCDALGHRDAEAIEAYSVWGGIPRYWELAADFPDLATAVQRLVLDPLGILHDEPNALLLDDLRDSNLASSLLQLIGQGCHRLSEIAGRLGRASGDLVRPIQRLLELELIEKELPFGCSEKDTKRTLYRVADPFLSFWHRFVAPHRSWLAQRLLPQVWAALQKDWPAHVASVWEALARQSVPHLQIAKEQWAPAGRWWGQGNQRRALEVDVVANSLDGNRLLLGSVKWSQRADFGHWIAELQRQAQEYPHAGPKQLALWSRVPPSKPEQRLCRQAAVEVVTPADVLLALR